MLIKADENNLDLMLEFCKNSLLGTRISCYLTAYGFEHSFVEYYLYINNDKISGIVANYDSNITLLLKDRKSDDELVSFLKMLPCNSITCSAPILKDDCEYVTTEKMCYIFDANSCEYDAEVILPENYISMYELISENIPNSFLPTKEAYLSFLSDFTYRERRNLARARGLFSSSGKLVACGITAAETADSALLSGIACSKSERAGGLGKRIVLSLVKELLKENKKAFVIALNDSAQGFYDHIGFKKCDKIFIYERN